jgi:hypothetical protein
MRLTLAARPGLSLGKDLSDLSLSVLRRGPGFVTGGETKSEEAEIGWQRELSIKLQGVMQD